MRPATPSDAHHARRAARAARASTSDARPAASSTAAAAPRIAGGAPGIPESARSNATASSSGPAAASRTRTTFGDRRAKGDDGHGSGEGRWQPAQTSCRRRMRMRRRRSSSQRGSARRVRCDRRAETRGMNRPIARRPAPTVPSHIHDESHGAGSGAPDAPSHKGIVKAAAAARSMATTRCDVPSAGADEAGHTRRASSRPATAAASTTRIVHGHTAVFEYAVHAASPAAPMPKTASVAQETRRPGSSLAWRRRRVRPRRPRRRRRRGRRRRA